MIKRNRILSVALTILICIALVGCGQDSELLTAMKENKDIIITVDGSTDKKEKEEYNWTELDQLSNYKQLRKEWDSILGTTIFDMGSKNGVLYVDLNGNWTGNNTLYNVFKNKKFVENFWKDKKIKSDLAELGINQFNDADGEYVGTAETIDAYFNLLPSNKDETSGLDENLTRAEAMGLIYRCDTPVQFVEDDPDNKLGVNENNIYTKEMLDSGYLRLSEGELTQDNYNGLISKGEFIYLLMNRYFPDEIEQYTGSEYSFNNFKNGGNIAEKQKFIVTDKKTGETTYGHAYRAYTLEYCIQNDKVDTLMAQALCLAADKGVISADFAFKEPLNGCDAINYILNTYMSQYDIDGYVVNAESGANAGTKLIDEPEEVAEEPEVETISLTSLESEDLPDVTDTDDMLRVYGEEFDLSDEEYEEAKSVLDGFTIEECDKWMVVNSNVNVRVGPSTEFRVVSTLAYNVKVHITGRCKETGWYRIAANKKIAYVCGAYLDELPESEWPSKPVTSSSVSGNSTK